MTDQNSIGITVRLKVDYQTALDRTLEALRTEGFGVLTEIDVKDTMHKKLNVDFRPYKILGACNPLLAYRALSAAPEIGLLLPCNVTVVYVEDGLTEVGLVNPMSMMSFLNNPDLQSVANEAHAKLERVAATLSMEA